MPRHALVAPLLRWFAAHKRDLPWRIEPRNPYHVWLSEVMLQQTRVASVIPYYRRWLERFPTLKAFAEASLDDVLKLWEGLGYYSRARNFHRAAQAVMREYGGRIPRTADELIKLPGIGRYTAGAITSLALNQHTPVLDGNVKRVLSRIFAISDDTSDLWALADLLLPTGRAGAFNEALMELGAVRCTPRSPNCPACPIRQHCTAYANGNPEAYPAKTVKAATPHVDVISAVIVDRQAHVLMGQRPRDGLLGGLWEFVSSEFRAPSSELIAAMIARRTGLKVGATNAQLLGTVKHAFTHFKITRHVYLILVAGKHDASLHPLGYEQLRWVPHDQIRGLALTRSDQKILGLYETHQASLLLFTQAG